jgi:O-acetylserine/cysteine efflux transporter
MSAPADRLSGTDIALLLLIALSWGVNNVVAKYATQFGPPLLAAGVRFGLQALLLLPFLRLGGVAWRPLFLVAVLVGPLHFALLYSGFAAASEVGPMTVIAQLWVPFSTLMAVVWLGEALRPQQVVGMLIAFVGVAVMTFEPRLFADLDAAGLILCASVIWAGGTVLSRRFGGLPALPLQAYMGLFTALLLVPASFLFEASSFAQVSQLPLPFWLAALFSAITAGIIGNGLMYRMVRRHPVTRTTSILLLTPVVSVLTAALWLGDAITPRLVLGTAMTLLGLLVVTRVGARATTG